MQARAPSSCRRLATRPRPKSLIQSRLTAVPQGRASALQPMCTNVHSFSLAVLPAAGGHPARSNSILCRFNELYDGADVRGKPVPFGWANALTPRNERGRFHDLHSTFSTRLSESAALAGRRLASPTLILLLLASFGSWLQKWSHFFFVPNS